MNAVLLKRLFRAIQSGSEPDIELLCQKIVADEKKRGHGKIAAELEAILSEARKTQRNMSPHGNLLRLPTNRRDLAPLVQEISIDQLRHQMVLPESVEKRFQRIEKEFAARHRLAKHGLRPRRRILLYGPPGCGKSLGAERLAWSTGLPLVKVRLDSLLSSYFGESLTNLRKVFEVAETAPCALFLDECDSLARSRTQRNDVGEITRITNALLEMLEEYKGDGLVIAATNLDSSLDSAFFRRFDEVLRIPLPGVGEVSRLLEWSLGSIVTDGMFDWQALAIAMEGRSGSEVVQVAQNAAKQCILEGRGQLAEADIRHSLSELTERSSPIS